MNFDVSTSLMVIVLVFYVAHLHRKISNLELRHKIHLDTHIDDDIDFGKRLIRNIGNELKK